MGRWCEVCCGNGMVRLAIHQRFSTGFDQYEGPFLGGVRVREYPCPACSDAVPQERLCLVSHTPLVASEVEHKQIVRSMVLREAAEKVADAILRKRLFVSEWGEPDEIRRTLPLRVTVGVVSPSAVVSLEDRIADNQQEFAREVAEEAAERIAAWGSHCTGLHGGIQKGQAIGEVRRALTVVAEKRRKRAAKREVA